VSWFFKAGLTGLAVICLFVVSAGAALARYPYDNGNHYGQLSNPGHHYGQLKHHQTPPPAPAPPPAPTPGRGTGHPGGSSAPPVTAGSQPVLGGTGGRTVSGIPDLPVILPPTGQTSDQVALAAGSRPAPGGLDWLVLLLIPALAALLVLSGARTAQRASERWGGRPKQS